MNRVVRWLIFSALVSLLPLLAVWVDFALHRQAGSLINLMGNGELLVLSWVLSASAFGELYGSDGSVTTERLTWGGITVVMLIAAALFYSQVAEARAAKEQIDDEFVVYLSILIFAISLVPSCLCLALIED